MTRSMISLARRVRRFLLMTAGKLSLALRKYGPPNRNGTVALLCLGGNSGTADMPRALRKLGYDVHLFCKEFPLHEARFATAWTPVDLLDHFERDHQKVIDARPDGVLVETRHLLLPAMARLQEMLGHRSVGELAPKTSNSKIAFHEALDAGSAPHAPWCRLKDYSPETMPFPFIMKPERGTGARGVTLVRNQSDFDAALEKIGDLENDPTIGGEVLLEGYIPGRQFDVEGLARDGDYRLLSLTEEHYPEMNGAFPSEWYLFSPPIETKMHENIVRTAFTALKALGVENGAFHMEMRLDADGKVFPIDYANRMGYPVFVSKCAEVSFHEQTIRVFLDEDWQPPQPKQKSIFQLFIYDKNDVAKMWKVVRTNPRTVIDLRVGRNLVAGVPMYGRVTLLTETHTEMAAILKEHELTPPSWEQYYS